MQTINLCRQTQKDEDVWAGKKAELVAEYRLLQSEKEELERRKAKIGERLKIRREQVRQLCRKIKESARVRAQLQSFLESVSAQLAEFIKNDLPFLPEERTDRLARVEEVIEETVGEIVGETRAISGKAAAEKYRVVMEALAIETEYGRTVEVYQDTVFFNGQSVLADILRLGRLSLFCRTPDGKMTGWYDPAAKTWILISSKYRKDINRAMEMARRERTIDMVKLPVGRIDVP